MPKSKAEVQRAYRERKKLREGEAYLEKERKRVRGYYVPIPDRAKKEQSKRRQKVRKWVQDHRDRKQKNATSTCSSMPPPGNNDEQCTEISSSSDPHNDQLLIVRLPCQQPKQRTRKRISRAVSKSRRDIERLTEENKTIERKYKRVSKRYERLLRRSQIKVQEENKGDGKVDLNNETNAPPSANTSITVVADIHAQPERSAMTPRKRTYAELRAEGVTPTKLPKIVKEKLVLTNVLVDEIKTAWNENDQEGKAAISNIVSGKLLKKYRLKSKLGLKTGIRRQNFNGKSKKSTEIAKKMRNVKQREKLRKDVKMFLEKDENSRVMPGKNDKVKTGGEYLQKRVLNDSMLYLHMKYKLERSSDIPFSTFRKLRPKRIALTKYLSRNKCLCQKHQNMALALKGMKNAGADIPINPDELVRQLQEKNVDAFLDEIKDEEVNYAQWKRVELPDGKKKTKIVERKINKAEFVEIAKKQVTEFQGHAQRVKTQYKALCNIKDSLPPGHAVVQMDFAENFSCSSADEVQSAYWNSTAVTLHPVVAYFRNYQGELNHRNFVYVSDDLGHNFGAVLTILRNLVPELARTLSNLEWIHYWTDSPSSQYRNKSAFYVVSDHKDLFGVNASWNYFETGHGKGPCDGIGGTSKRAADLAIKQGKITVQDAEEYFENVKALHRSAEYRYVSSTEMEIVRAELAEINKSLTSVKGTMQIHQVVPSSKGTLKTLPTSCYCVECLKGNVHGYTEAVVYKPTATDKTDPEIESPNSVNVNEGQEVEPTLETLASNSEQNAQQTNDGGIGSIAQATPELQETVGKDDWVAVVYEKEWYIGKVLSDIDEDNELEVSFLRSTKSLAARKEMFKWPTPADILNVKRVDIFHKINELEPIGRSGRCYRLRVEDYEQISLLFLDR